MALDELEPIPNEEGDLGIIQSFGHEREVLLTDLNNPLINFTLNHRGNQRMFHYLPGNSTITSSDN